MNPAVPHDQRVRNLFDQKASQWDDKYRVALRHRLNLFCNRLVAERPPPARVLDFGCGSGVFVTELVEKGYEVVGIDFSAAMIERCQSNLGNKQLSASVYHGSLDQLEHQLGQFDAVICSSVIEYLHNPADSMRALSRLLRPEGVILLSIPNRDSWRKMRQRLVQRIQSLLKPVSFIPKVKGYCDFLNLSVNIYRPSDLSCLAESCGFAVQDWLYFDPVSGACGRHLKREGESLFAVLEKTRYDLHET